MRKLFRFLRPYGGSVAVIICVLMLQAYCDLSLPTYTSDIVNVGIQQNGIDETVPESLAEEDLEHLLLFVSDDEKRVVQEAFEKGESHTDGYSVDYNGSIFSLKKSVKEESGSLEELAEVLEKPMMLVSGFDSESGMAEEIRKQLSEMGERMPGIEEQSVYDLLSMMPDVQRTEVISGIIEKLDSVPDSIMEQSASVFIKNAYEKVGIDTDKLSSAYIVRTGAAMLGLAALGMAASILVGFLASRVGAGIGRGLRRNVFRKVVGFSNAEFDKFSTASLITRSTNDIQQIQLLTVMILRMVLYAPIMAVGGVWRVFHTNVDMSWIIALGVVLILIVVGFLFFVVMPKFKVVQSLVDRLNLVSREILTGLSVIRAFSTEKYEEERFDEANRDLMKTNLFVNRAMTFMMPAMMLIMNGITVLIIWVGGHGVNEGAMQVGDTMAFIQYTMQIIMSFLMICMISVMLPRAAVSADRVDEILKSETLIRDAQDRKQLPEDGKGEVCFHNVSFRYPGAEEDVLHDISFTAKPGQTTAFVGGTGSGKSTLINLIPRFYDVTEGSITVDGVDIRDIPQHDLREKLGYVPQKGVLFSGTIASNIMYGNPKGTEEEMKEAAQIAQAEEFILDKKKGYESPVAQGGANVSGGQKQRLSIARAVAKHPDIYIFDDSFSALDYKTDVSLRNALKENTKEAAVLIVAQRVSTILHAEQIIVLDDGKVAGMGTHKELLKNCDAYYQIAASQMSEKELEEAMKEVE